MLALPLHPNGKVSGVKMVRTEMGEPDAKGRRRAEIVAGSEHIVPADAVIMAFGFRPHNMEWLAKHSVELDSQGRIIAPEGKRDIRVSTANGRMVLTVTDDDLVRVNMGEPNFEPSAVPFRANKAEKTYIMRAAVAAPERRGR